MKKNLVVGIMAGILLVMGAGIASAGSTWDPRVDRRELRQERRIEWGVASGRLTPWEARVLKKEQARIRFMEARMKSDGHLTFRERQILNQRLNVASRDIWRLNHNGYYW
ncbi:MAG: hypothetical protein EG822_09145 [Deltaproteobacteria bacterium]|nr:hypothetical protein [Deltaproteobacteria bacterium]MRR54661.1 hypothetical protein [Deltaproteobacteria bacterium]TLN02454.1 MAG: hypothetical protein FDZ73_11675 [bacterium]